MALVAAGATWDHARAGSARDELKDTPAARPWAQRDADPSRHRLPAARRRLAALARQPGEGGEA